ncbi:F-box protein At3g57590-like [Lycium barbarum]|uniref:F-box protein At3g57590-like n=1 Tax=Lycium barbarum TaxID=112863 RepID=UPI00293E7DC4|nr:F-box protein At3g57590-like [Lycium barbarum]
MRFKCFSKLCNVIILDPYFADIHQSRSISRPDHRTKLLLRCQGNIYTIDSNSRQPKACILPPLEKLDGLNYPKFEYAKGVFCLWSSCNHTAVICNPSTGEVRFLPHLSKVGEDLRTYLCYCSIGFDPNKRRHKILMTLYDTANKSTRLGFHFIGLDESWREIKSIPYFKPLMMEGVYIDEAVYFFGAFANSSRINIVEFNVRTEEIRTISLWYDKEIRTDIELYFNLVEIEGKLAAIDSRSNGIQIWILRSPETEEWIDWLDITFKKN